MPNVIEPSTDAARLRFAVVVAEWNKSITQKLLDGALACFSEAGVADDAIDVAWVPGAWEIPVVTQRLADSCRYAGILTLGAVIKGDTAHDHWINHGVTEGLMRIAIEHSRPVMFGVLTCETLEQAIQRSGGSVGNKGRECAQAALQMAGLLQSLPTR